MLPIEAKSGRHYRSHVALDRLLAQRGYGIRRALVLSTGNTDRVSPIEYLPVYLVMFLDHDGLPPDLTFPKPSLDLPVSPHFNLTANDDQAIWTKCPGWEDFEPLCS